MDIRDRAFLQDMLHVISLNHIATSFTLHRTLERGETELEWLAMQCIGLHRHYPSEEALQQEVQQNHDAKRMERILCARIFQEYIAAVEDLGALGSAIRHRHKGGIFARYLKSSTGEAAEFFDKVLAADISQQAHITLEHLLDLPPASALASHFSAEDITAFTQSYRDQAVNLDQAARIYRENVNHMTSRVPPSAAQNASQDVNVLLDILPAGQSPQSATPVVRAFNKLKHRFMVTERLGEYTDPSGSDTIEYARFPQEPDTIRRIIGQTEAVIGTTLEMVALVYQLDASGVTV